MKWFRLLLHLIEIWLYVLFSYGVKMEYSRLISTPRYAMDPSISLDNLRLWLDMGIYLILIIRIYEILLFWIKGKVILQGKIMLVLILVYALLIAPDVYLNLQWYYYGDMYLARAIFFASPIVLWSIDYFLKQKYWVSASTSQVD